MDPSLCVDATWNIHQGPARNAPRTLRSRPAVRIAGSAPLLVPCLYARRSLRFACTAPSVDSWERGEACHFLGVPSTLISFIKIHYVYISFCKYFVVSVTKALYISYIQLYTYIYVYTVICTYIDIEWHRHRHSDDIDIDIHINMHIHIYIYTYIYIRYTILAFFQSTSQSTWDPIRFTKGGLGFHPGRGNSAAWPRLDNKYTQRWSVTLW